MMMKTATSFGGPFILIPQRLVSEWVESIGDQPDPDHGLYGKVCEPREYLAKIQFESVEVVKIGEGPDDLFWVPRESGGLIIQWVAADSEEELIKFAEEITNDGQWEETMGIEFSDSKMQIMDSCGFEGDGQPKIDFEMTPGLYQLSAVYAENENTMAVIYELKLV